MDINIPKKIKKKFCQGWGGQQKVNDTFQNATPLTFLVNNVILSSLYSNPSQIRIMCWL